MNPLPKDKFNIIYADPPWKMKTFSEKGLDGRPQHYPRMTLTQLKEMPVYDLAAKDSFLFMWTTSPHLDQALTLGKHWGFKYSAIAFTWVKLYPKSASNLFLITPDDFPMGMGYTTRQNTEPCLLFRKGKPKRKAKDVRELIIAARREHSRKPDEAYNRIEEFSDGPYLELFARQTRPGWTAWGNETSKFGEMI